MNTDAGTMSPFEHGEVFVLDDGGEVNKLKFSTMGMPVITFFSGIQWKAEIVFVTL